MPTLKLTYFDAPGRAESIRLCFVHAGIEFEDVRISFQEWTNMKTAVMAGEKKSVYQMPFLPWLEVDGVVISQSIAILRYAAAVSGLDGKTPLEKAKVDMILSTFHELINESIKYLFSSGDNKEEVLTAAKEVWKRLLSSLDAIMSANNGGEKWLVGDSMTAADIAMYSFLRQAEELLNKDEKSIYDGLDIPHLKSLVQRVGEVEKIKEYCTKQSESATKS